jgi:hypothetical protein
VALYNNYYNSIIVIVRGLTMGDTNLWDIIAGIAFIISLLFGFFGVLFL